MTKLIDLTHPLEHGMPAFPGDPEPAIEPLDTLEGAGYNTTRISMSSHTGTHLDVPFHFFDDGKTLEQVEIGRFHGPAVLVDLAAEGALAPGTRLSRETLERHTELFRPGARILYRTGWDKRFGSGDFFEGYPSLTLEAASWIASRRIGLLGMDTPSPSEDFAEVHRVLLGPEAEIIVVESLANLDQLPPAFTLSCLPLPFRGRDGSPVRAVAITG